MFLHTLLTILFVNIGGYIYKTKNDNESQVTSEKGKKHESSNDQTAS